MLMTAACVPWFMRRCTAPDAVQAGAPFAVRLVLDVEDDVEMLAVRLSEVAGASYVPGSASVDGRSLLDRAGAPPFAGDGLLLRGIPGGTRIDRGVHAARRPGDLRRSADRRGRARRRRRGTAVPAGRRARARPRRVRGAARGIAVSRRCVHRRAGAHRDRAGGIHGAGAAAESMHTAAAPVRLPVTARDVVALAETLEAPLPAHIAETGDDAFTFASRLDDQRLDEIARLLHGATGAGLVAHALVLRALFPDDETSGDRDRRVVARRHARRIVPCVRPALRQAAHPRLRRHGR